MGAYCDGSILNEAQTREILDRVIHPTVEATGFTGFLYAGLMIDANGDPRTVEFNCRMGDPETQPIMMRLKSDLFDVLMHATDGTLDQVELQWDRRVALGVVMAAAGYPLNPRKGDAVRDLPPEAPDAVVFHAGTTVQDQQLKTSGGRVLCATALGDSVKQAQQRAYALVHGIHFDGAQYRRDIGHRAIKR